MTVRHFFATLLISAVALPNSRAQSIQIAPITEVAREAEPRRFFEPHLASHPSNPQHLLAGAMIASLHGTFQESVARQRCAAFHSRDGGVTWKRHEFSFSQCYDPQVAILPDGKAVFIALAEVPGVQPRNSNWLVAFHSSDGGVSWEDDVTIIGYGHDHPVLAVDVSSSQRKGWIYVTSHHTWRDGNGQRASGVFVARSRNGGRSFDAPTIVSPNNMHTFGETPVVLADGTLMISYVDGLDTLPQRDRRSAWIARSTDGGTTFSKSWFITDECGPPPVFQLSDLARDASGGPFHDRLYFACRQRAGGPALVIASTDRGANWNRPGAPVGSTTRDTSARRVMNVRVNQKGVVGVFVAERLSSGGGHPTPCLQYTFSASLDGAKTFGAPQIVSSMACGQSQADSVAARRFPTYGDYFGIVAMPDDSFRLVWAEMREGRSVLLTTTARVAGARNGASQP
ncbi:MAG TPA: sialidase family protein [Gemmatimonadaceae bacterium]|nr:sialidase family protein [Gemmatimonadaceae bacterium]